MQIRKIGEQKLIERIKKKTGAAYPDTVLLGIGDDCAALEVPSQEILLASTDTLVEHNHFDLKKILPYQLGWKSMAVNMSDIAAMGGTCRYALISLCAPGSLSVDFIERLFDGFSDIALRYDTAIIGGDTVSSRNDLSITVSVLGTVSGISMVKRSTAKIGDKIFVTGSLGASPLGLALLKGVDESFLKNIIPLDDDSLNKNLEDENLIYLITKHLLPTPRIKEAKELISHFDVTSMIDLSDSLALSLHEIARQSKVGVKIFKEKLPFSTHMKAESQKLNHDIFDYALYGGEEYELLFTSKIDDIDGSGILKYATYIGDVVEAGVGAALLDEDKKSIPIQDKGYSHF